LMRQLRGESHNFFTPRNDWTTIAGLREEAKNIPRGKGHRDCV
jgi:hypothetical protein